MKDDDGAYFRGRQQASQVWKGAVWGAELLRKGIIWDVRNGERVRFWKDVWLGSRPLIEEGVGIVDQDQEDCKVGHYWHLRVGWKWHDLQ